MLLDAWMALMIYVRFKSSWVANIRSISASAKGWSLVQRSPTVCLIVCVITETPKREAKGPSWTIIACEWMNDFPYTYISPRMNNRHVSGYSLEIWYHSIDIRNMKNDVLSPFWIIAFSPVIIIFSCRSTVSKISVILYRNNAWLVNINICLASEFLCCIFIFFR
jgi:hypothetical protein